MSGSRVAFVGADGSLGTALSTALGATGVRLRCPSMIDAAPVGELAEADVVINAAGPRHHPGLRWSDYLREHVGTASCVARSVRPGAYLVHVSSSAVYGAGRRGAGADTPEDPASFPSEAYAWAKLASEHAARAICRERGVALTVLRPSVVYGPGVDGIVATLRGLARRGVRPVLSPPGIRQHLLHVDLLRGVLEALVRRRAGEAHPLLVVADPFVLTAGDLNEVLRHAAPGAVAVPVPLRPAADVVRVWQGRVDVQPPAKIMAAAALAIDNEYAWRPTFEALGIDPGAFGRERFDRYLEAE